MIDLAQHCNEKITIITPMYNPDPELFTRCAKTVFKQSNTEFKWIIVCDGDKSTRKLTNHPMWDDILQDERITVKTYKKHKGVSYARNLGMDEVNSGWILFLDYDNWIHIDTIDFLKQAIRQTTPDMGKVFFTFGQSVVQQNNACKGTNLRDMAFRNGDLASFGEILKRNRIDLGQMLIPVDKSLRFDTSLQRLVDWDFLLNMLRSEYGQLALPFYMSFYDNMPRNGRISIDKDYTPWRKKLQAKWQKTASEYLSRQRSASGSV